MRWERTWHREGGYREEGGRRKGGRGGERVCMIALCVGMDMSGYINILQIPKAHVYVYMYMQSTTKCTYMYVHFVNVHSTCIQVYITLP